MDWIFSLEAWITLVTLTALEIVLGIDNIIFILVVVSRLPKDQRSRGRIFGLALAMITRIVLVISINFIIRLTAPIFSIWNNDISGRDIILIIGGLFLLIKSAHEIYSSFEESKAAQKPEVASNFVGTLIQIALLDIILSLDSVITAVAIARNNQIMIVAIVIAVLVMMVSAKVIGEFVEENPTIKMLALCFTLLIGVTLFAEGLEFDIPKGYIYSAVTFAVIVEILNIKVRSARDQ